MHIDWANHFVPYDINRFTDEYKPYDIDQKFQIPDDSQLISIRQGDFKLLKNAFPVRNTSFGDYSYLLFNVGENQLEERDVKNLYPQKFEEMKKELDDWFAGILQEEHAFTSPVFFINSNENIILGKASQRISDNLVNAGFFLTGWSFGNQQAEYNIEVTEEGWYKVSLDFSEFENESEFTVKVGGNTATNTVKEMGKNKIGDIYVSTGQQRLQIKNSVVAGKAKTGKIRLSSISLEKIPEN